MVCHVPTARIFVLFSFGSCIVSNPFCNYFSIFPAVLLVYHTSVEALSESLSNWGDEMGSMVVISHDKAFCEKVGFTHVATVQADGSLRLEQRGTRDSDWDSSVATVQRSSTVATEKPEKSADDRPGVLDPKLRKQAYNAPKRIAKIESLVEQKEGKIAELEDEMLANGSDVGTLLDLTKEKEQLEEQVMELMEEWEELETLLAQQQVA